MEQKWIDWFLDNTINKTFTIEKRKHCQYEYFNYHRDSVPFDSDFNLFLSKLVGDSNFNYDVYHIHKWKEGSYFNTHKDDRDNRRFAYVQELQESECKTKLLVNETAKEYDWFDVHTYHSVPVIKKGERISLTVFGKKIIKKGIL
jgi:hypothetical protein